MAILSRECKPDDFEPPNSLKLSFTNICVHSNFVECESFLESDSPDILAQYKTNLNDSIDGSVLDEKSYFKMLDLAFSSKLDWSSYIISVARTASKKVGALIHSMKFLSLEVALYLYESTIQPFMECCCHVWPGALSCYLKLLDKRQKQIYRTFDPSLAASLEPLAHHQNVVRLSPFYRYYFVRCSSELAELVSLPFS